MPDFIHYQGKLYVAQEPNEEGPSEGEMVEELEEEPGANWRDLYLQPIIRAIRNQLDLAEGQVKLLGPRKVIPFDTDAYGFEIRGHVRFDNFVPDQESFGRPPYRFTAIINPEGELMSNIRIEGH
jgi:hypothetical protein